MIGFIKLHRKITDWEWYSDTNVFRVFMHLLFVAKFKDETWRGVEIKRGQVLTGRSSLAKSTTLTERQVRTALTKLKSTNEISIKTTSEFSIITLTNYELYQGAEDKNDQQNDQRQVNRATNERPANDQLTTTVIRNTRKKEIQEDKENNIYAELAEGLKFILEAKLNRKLNTSSWKKEIKLLIEKDLSTRENAVEDVKRAIQEISKRFGEQYFPVVQSASSLREKFSKIEDAIKRSKKQINSKHNNFEEQDYYAGTEGFLINDEEL